MRKIFQASVLFSFLIFHSWALTAQDKGVQFAENAGRLFGAEKYEECIPEYDKAIKASKHNPDRYLFYLHRAIAKSRTGDFWGAKDDLDATLKLKPGYADAYLYRGTLFMILDEDQLAMNDYTKAIQHDPNNAYAHLYKADLLYEFKDYGKSIFYYSEAIRLNPDFEEAFLKRAGVHYVVQNYESAIADYTVVLEKESSGDVYFMRGLCKSMLDEKDGLGACDDFEKAKELGTNINIPGLDVYCKSEAEQ
jgi:tetratricopeptide (TPR) repeat protein